MSKSLINLDGRVYKRGLSYPISRFTRLEFVDMLSDDRDLIEYETTSVIIGGCLIRIERATGETEWTRAES